MRVAVLVLAYSAPVVLAAASRIYRRLGWDIYVHLDAKADAARYRAEMGEAAALVNFVEPPLAVLWGGFSMVEAEIRLIETALRAASYDFLLYVSDDTWPMRSHAELAAMPTPEVERIMMRKVGPGTPYYQRYMGLYLYDHPATNPRGVGPARVIDDALATAVSEALVIGRMGKKSLDVYWGFAYWLLTRPTVEAVLQICRADPLLWYSFKYAAQPDELLVQTVIGNYLLHRKTVDGPVHMDFSKPNGPVVYRTPEELPADLPAHCFFLRKVAAGALPT